MAGVPWVESEDEFIRQNFQSMTCEEMATHLPGRTKKAVQHRYNALKLKKKNGRSGR